METVSKRNIATAKCGSCEHTLTEHYHIKSNGYGCIGDGHKCNCSTFIVE